MKQEAKEQKDGITSGGHVDGEDTEGEDDEEDNSDDDEDFDEDEAESCVDAFDGLECQVTAAAEIEACYQVSDCYQSEPEESDDPT